MQTYPIFKESAIVDKSDPNLVNITYMGNMYTLRDAAAEIFTDLQGMLTGENAIEDIANKTPYSVDKIDSFIKSLSRCHLVSIRGAESKLITGLEFYDYHRRYCTEWLKEIYEHPFWDKVVNGTATDPQIIGFAFEKYHYIEGAHEHMGIAAANATPEMMPHLSKHFCEEYTHGDIYMSGLAKIYDNETVLKSIPLPSTRALINYLNEAAATDSFAYYAANEFLQMTENDEEENSSYDAVDDFYNKMIEHYPYTKPLVRSFIAHTQLDQKLGHDNAFYDMCKDVPPLTLRQVGQVMETVRGIVDALKIFMDGIDTFYINFNEIPRLPATTLTE